MTPYTPDHTDAWATLSNMAKHPLSIAETFRADDQHTQRWYFRAAGIEFDFSKHGLSQTHLDALLELAKQSPLEARRADFLAGNAINQSENRAVLHPALRDFGDIEALTSQFRSDVERQREQMLEAADRVRSGIWRGLNGEQFTDIINIGIGGSDLGPKLAYEALREFRTDNLRVHYISNVDGAEIISLLRSLNPATTLTAIASKTFTTQETLLNAKTALNWYESELGIRNIASTPHVVALTANPENAIRYGVDPSRILPFEEWVGGRYSLWSSIGFSLACAIGSEGFTELLQGAHAMDKHFAESPFEDNVPVLMALIGIWHINFGKLPTQAVIPYCERMGLLSAYLQQLDMESNGKTTLQSGGTVNTDTGPIVWGQTGTNGQHAFFQLMHQGTHTIPVDFIAALSDALSNDEHHRTLLVNMFAQAAALMTGRSAPDGEPFRHYPGNRPSSLIMIPKLTPAALGALIALYEHKVFVQGVIWGINSFDQWGVELGKKLTNELLPLDADLSGFDGSTQHWMSRLNEL